MNLPELQAELQAHLDRRPVQPCLVSQMTPKQYATWSRDLASWVEAKDALQSLIESYGIRMEFKRQAPQCSPKADYIYREPMGRKRPPRPAWSGATPEYNRKKQAERRARIKAEREAKIRESMAERKIA